MNDILRELHHARMERREPTVRVLQFQSHAIKILEKHGSCLGSSLWDASLALKSYMEKTFTTPFADTFRVVELGCGCVIL